MFGRIGAAVARHPWRVIAVWVAAMVALSVGGGMKIYDVTTSEQRDLLSSKFESVKAADLGDEAFGKEEGTTPITALVRHADGARLTVADRQAAARIAGQMPRFRPNWDEIDNKVQFLTDK